MSLLKAYLTKPSTQRVLNRKPGDKGFSLIELVVVVAVLAILAAIAVPAFMGMSESAADAAVDTNLKNAYKECTYQVQRGKFNRGKDFPNFEKPGDDAYYKYKTNAAEEDGVIQSCYSDDDKTTTTLTGTKSGKTAESKYGNGDYTMEVTTGKFTTKKTS